MPRANGAHGARGRRGVRGAGLDRRGRHDYCGGGALVQLRHLGRDLVLGRDLAVTAASAIRAG
jgi:hypothetical protein